MDGALSFSGLDVRIRIDEQGQSWWVLADVCAVLGLTNPSQAALGLAEDETTLSANEGGIPPAGRNEINESGLYRLIFRSNKAAAEPFRLWVFREVLPAIRKTGRYDPGERKLPPASIPRESAEVSLHLVRVWVLLRDNEEWLSNRQIAHRCAISARTARAHTRYLLQLGLLDMLETFPARLYRMSPSAEKRNVSARQRLDTISAVVESRQPKLPALR